MDPIGKINELQQQILMLADDVNASVRQLRILQDELDRLKASCGIGTQPGTETKPVTKTPDRQTSSASAKSLEGFIGLKLMHLVGIVVLVTGISIGVKYAIDKRLISELLRIVLAYGAGILLFVISARLKRRYASFSAILFSGSMASIYFTTYAASSYYQFISPVIAFLLMVALTVYTVLMAMAYDRKEIAIIGLVGAYGIPFLISTNTDRVSLFFTYILLINLGVAFLAIRKRWKPMNQFALYITWLLYLGWAFFRYTVSHQSIAILFMVLFYILFLAGTAGGYRKWFAQFSIGDIQHVLFNNAALYLGTIMVFTSSNGTMALASVVTFLVVSVLALLSWNIFPTEIILQRTLIFQSLALLLLFIVFQWDGFTVTLLWVAVSVALFTWGVLGRKAWVRLASVLLMGFTLIKLLLYDSRSFSTVQKISCYLVIGVLLLLFSFYYQRLKPVSKTDSFSENN